VPTTSRGFRYPSASAAPNVSQDIANLAEDVNDWVSSRYYATAAGGIGITTGNLPAAPAASTAQLNLPAGKYDLDFSGSFALSVSAAGREIELWVEQAGVGKVASTYFTVNQVGGTSSCAYQGMGQVTLAATAILYLRVKANAAGGTQSLGTNSLRAVRTA
jgi:hypothetical protein